METIINLFFLILLLHISLAWCSTSSSNEDGIDGGTEESEESEESEGDTDTTAPILSEVTGIQLQAQTPQQITLFHSKFQKSIFSYYCTVKLHVSDCALPPLGSEATTFQ